MTLANEKRLLCLRFVFASPGETVGDIAVAARLPQDQSSLCLRALQARGLLFARRSGRWVRYFPKPDPWIGSSKKILAAMRQALVDDNRPDAEVIRCLTAFTHPRRVTRVLCLKRMRHPLSFSLLGEVCRMSEPALSRHLGKLRERGVAEETAEGWRLASKRSRLTNRLLAVICETERTTRR